MLFKITVVLHETDDIGEIGLLLLALFPCHIVHHARPQSIMPSAFRCGEASFCFLITVSNTIASVVVKQASACL